VQQEVAAGSAPRRPGWNRFPTEAALVAGLREGLPAATAEVFARFGEQVYRLLRGIVGPSSELPDLVQDVFVDLLRGIQKLREVRSLGAWITRVTVLAGRTHLRSRRRREWLRLVAPEELPEIPVDVVDHVAAEALRATDRVLSRLGADERLVFVLRYVEGMQLTEVAQACGASLATVKRRLVRAELHFRKDARGEPSLSEWLRVQGLEGQP
jgi:RNA polymerase sigma-70 factor, ECF subfamily